MEPQKHWQVKTHLKEIADENTQQFLFNNHDLLDTVTKRIDGKTKRVKADWTRMAYSEKSRNVRLTKTRPLPHARNYNGHSRYVTLYHRGGNTKRKKDTRSQTT